MLCELREVSVTPLQAWRSFFKRRLRKVVCAFVFCFAAYPVQLFGMNSEQYYATISGGLIVGGKTSLESLYYPGSRLAPVENQGATPDCTSETVETLYQGDHRYDENGYTVSLEAGRFLGHSTSFGLHLAYISREEETKEDFSSILGVKSLALDSSSYLAMLKFRYFLTQYVSESRQAFLQPFVHAGLGFARTEMKGEAYLLGQQSGDQMLVTEGGERASAVVTFDEASNYTLAGQVGIGLTFMTADNAGLRFEYRASKIKSLKYFPEMVSRVRYDNGEVVYDTGGICCVDGIQISDPSSACANGDPNTTSPMFSENRLAIGRLGNLDHIIEVGVEMQY